MASSITKTTCAKCSKGAGTAMCYGCQQRFCTKHFIEHRQELSQQIDYIGQEHDGLRRDLTNEQDTHALLGRINHWELESIAKIQITARSARTDLQQLLNRAKNNLKTSFNKMAEELQLSRDSDDFTELNINKWINQLKEFRKMLDTPPSIKIDYNKDAASMIRLIKVTDQQSSNSFHQVLQLRQRNNSTFDDLGGAVSEKFEDAFGCITLSESDLVATCSKRSENWCCVSGIGRYSSGTHRIRFRIEECSAFFPFFGIVNSSEKMASDIRDVASCYGWRDLNYYSVSGQEQSRKVKGCIQVADEVILILDCNKRRIQLQNHRTNRAVDITVDVRRCAFPWKMILFLRLKGDRVRILH